MIDQPTCAVPDVLPVLGLLLMTLIGVVLISAALGKRHYERHYAPISDRSAHHAHRL